MSDGLGFEVAGFQALVGRHWLSHLNGVRPVWETARAGEDPAVLVAAPAFEEVMGGPHDGLRLWSAYSMNLTDLFEEPDVDVIEFGFHTRSAGHRPAPLFSVRGQYKRRGFYLELHLEPVPGSRPVPVYDTLTARPPGEKS